MYKVMIIDDEPLVRITIKSLVNWEEEGFNIYAEASNAKQALDIIIGDPTIDMIVTDINMPVMDGIELLTELKKRRSKVPVIVLSGYNDYSLVRQAFRLGAEDYILKSEMTPESLIEIFKNTIKKNQSVKKPIDEKMVTEQEKNIIKINYLKEILLNDLNDDIHPIGEELAVDTDREYMVVCEVLVDDYRQIVQEYTSHSLMTFMHSIVHSIEEVIKKTGEVVSISPDEYIILLGFSQRSHADMKEMLNEILGSIRYVLENYVNIQVTIGVSPIKQGIGELKSLRKQAKDNAHFRFLLGKGKNIFPEEVIGRGNKQYLESGEIEKNIIEALKSKEYKTILESVEVIFKSISKLKIENINQTYSFYMEIIFTIGKHVNHMGFNKEEVYISDSKFYEKLIEFETLEEINTYIKQIIFTLFQKMNEDFCYKKNRTIAKAISFIKEHYADKELSLKAVSDHVELSLGHFSTLFAKEVDMSFKDFITHMRVEKAKELILETNLKVYEISEAVGYANVEHFSRVFKKITGTSPNQFFKS